MLLDWSLALAPLVLIVILMIRLRWGAARAGAAGWLAGVLIAVGRFGAGLDLLAFAQGRAFFLALDVLLIIWAAFLLYRVCDEAGAIRALGEALPHLTSDRGMMALLIGWAFASFLQGVGGFGVPVAVTAPLLYSLGFPPLVAVVAPSLGHAWSVTFGSLAASFQAMIVSTGLTGESLAPASAFLLGLAGFGCGSMVAHAAGGWTAVRRLTLPIVLLATTMGSAQYLLATHGLWNIAGFGGGLAGLAVSLLLTRRFRGDRLDHRPAPDGWSALLSLAGYAALVIVTLLVQLTPGLKELLGHVVVQLPFPEIRTARGFVTLADPGPRIVLLRHAGALLTYASAAAYLIYRLSGRYERGALRRILIGTVQGVMPSTLGIAAMVSLAVVMAYAGMTDTLARGLAQAAGSLFPLASPWIGAIGAFISGSNANSNLLFSILQQRTAELLGVSVPLILAAQTAGGAIGSVLAPTKVAVAVGTLGGFASEGEIIQHLMRYAAVLLAGLSLAMWLWLQVAPS